MVKKSAFIILGLMLLSGCAYLGYLKDPFEDIPNFHKVDQALYRGGQPKENGYAELKALGIKTIISFREGNKAALKEKEIAQSMGINFYNIPLSVYKKPEDSQAVAFLDIVLTEENQPVFVHCSNGRDRTGTMIAMYKVTARGWTIKNAYKEARSLGFFPYRGEAELKNFIHQLKDKQIYFQKAKEKMEPPI